MSENTGFESIKCCSFFSIIEITKIHIGETFHQSYLPFKKIKLSCLIDVSSYRGRLQMIMNFEVIYFAAKVGFNSSNLTTPKVATQSVQLQGSLNNTRLAIR